MRVILLLAICLIMVEKGFTQAPSVFTETPVLSGLQGNSIRTFVRRIAMDSLLDYSFQLNIPVNITPEIQVGGVLPIATLITDQAATSNGPGDIAFFAKNLIAQKDLPGKSFRMMAKFLEFFPTGSTSVEPALGTGYFRSEFSLVSAFITPRLGMYNELGLHFNHAPAQHRVIDRYFFYGFSMGYSLLPDDILKDLNLYLGMNGRKMVHDKKQIHLIAPAFQYSPIPQFLFEAGIQFPVVQIAENSTHMIILGGTRIYIYENPSE